MKEKKVTILYTVYKENIDLIKQSFESLLNQTYSNIEIIILLDIYRNDAIEYFNSFDDKRIRLHINEKNLGIVKNLNIGIELAAGEYLARMDADDISDVFRIEKQLDFLELNSLDLVGCDVQPFDDKGNFFKKWSYPKNTDNCYRILDIYGCIAHPAFFGKLEVFKNLNGYRDIDTCEDLDFLLRCRAQRVKLGNLSECLLKYRLNDSGISISNKAKQILISEFLLSQYEKKPFVSMNEYLSFIRTKKFTKRLNSLNLYLKLSNKNFIFRLFFLEFYKENYKRLLSYIYRNTFFRKVFIKIKKAFTSYDNNRIFKKRIYFLGSADYSNIGDLAISEATILFLKKVFLNFDIIEIGLNEFDDFLPFLRLNIHDGDLIIMQGGGNLGTKYFQAERNRRLVFRTFKNNNIVLFPCSIDYGSSKKDLNELKKSVYIYSHARKLCICARDEYCFDYMSQCYQRNNIIFTPDIVLFNERKKYDKSNIYGICLRKDIESTNSFNFDLSDLNFETFDNVTFKNYISKVERKKIVADQISKVGRYKAVVTDRLHVMIFCYLTYTPCLAIDNSNHKIMHVFEYLKKCEYIFMNITLNDFVDVVESGNVIFLNADLDFHNLSCYLSNILK